MSTRNAPNSKYPSLRMVKKSFAPLHRTMRQLATGEVAAIKGRPVHIESNGEWCEIVTSARALISCMERIRPDVTYPDLSKMLAKLDAGMLLEELDLLKANHDVRRMQFTYTYTPRSVILKHIKTELIAIELDSQRSRSIAA